MLRDFLLLCLVSNFIVPSISTEIKQWVPNFSFNDPLLWTNAHLPCPDQLILFPTYFYTLLDLPPTLTTKGFILPAYGILALPSNGQIDFNQNHEDDCVAKSGVPTATFKHPESHFWYLSHNWRELNADGAPKRINRAKPHMDRIPCTYDEVKFPRDRNFKVDFQMVPSVDFAKIQDSSPEDFQRTYNSIEGQMIFNNADMIYVNSRPDCTSDECPCHAEYAVYVEAVLCENEKKFCEPALCLHPIKPPGFCCEICGASFQGDLDKSNISLTPLKNVIDRNLRTMSEAHDVEYYVGIFLMDEKVHFQLIITDLGEYDEKSTKLMKRFQTSIIFPFILGGPKLKMSYSGRPYKPNEPGSLWNFIFIPLVFIGVFFFTIYTYYYKIEDGKLQILTWSIPVTGLRRFRTVFTSWNSQFIFARFENTRDDGEMSVAELQIQAGPASKTTQESSQVQIESQQTELNQEERDEMVENLLEIDLED
ncbi:hypothetical protein DMENIID0001_102350 [Sergentomyia squamirostris]